MKSVTTIGRWLQRTILGHRTDDRVPGSNRRRAMARLSVFVTIVLGVELLLSRFGLRDQSANPPLAIALVFWSLIYFLSALVLVFFLRDRDWTPSARRLFQDALISGSLAILSFAYLYRILGIIPPGEGGVGVLDHLYFSAVTFSTLGFGDFRPAETARLVAAGQAILGNLHLGIVVGAVFLSARGREDQ